MTEGASTWRWTVKMPICGLELYEEPGAEDLYGVTRYPRLRNNPHVLENLSGTLLYALSG